MNIYFSYLGKYMIVHIVRDHGWFSLDGDYICTREEGEQVKKAWLEINK